MSSTDDASKLHVTAVDTERRTLHCFPPSLSDRRIILIWLAFRLYTRYEQFGEVDGLNDAIRIARGALLLLPPGHPDRSICLQNMSGYLSTRYKQFGWINDLNEAINLGRDALSLFTPGCPLRSASLSNLAICLSTRYKQYGGINDLNEAVDCARDVLLLLPTGHPDLPSCLENLSGYLSARYIQSAEIDDLNEATSLARDALSLSPPGHPDRSIYLNSLATCLSTRYTHIGGVDDLNEAINLGRDALPLLTPGYLFRSTSLNNLAFCLYTRYKQLGGINDLNDAIDLARGALLLLPTWHPGRSSCLNNISTYLSIRYNRVGGADDLNEAIDLVRNALFSRPPGHPGRSTSLNTLAMCLSARYKQVGEVGDLNEAINLGKEAISLIPPGHLDWSASLNNLALDISTRYKEFRGNHDKQALFNLYSELQHVPKLPSSNDLIAAKRWIDAAEIFRHPTTILAYETALRLLVEYTAMLPSLPQHHSLIKSLSSSLAVDAFSACLRDRSPYKAVELLEQGRGVFWTQLTRLFAPLDDVISSGPVGKGLADEYTRLTSTIRAALRSPGKDQHDRVYGLNSELQKVVSRIRVLPGLSRFLLPSLFSDLRNVASGGPVIVVNASKYGCDALVVFVDRDPVHIPLSVTREDVQAMASTFHALTRFAKKKEPKDKEVEKGFMTFLRNLWDDVISHIIDSLQKICPRGSRIWWCPTSDFSFLPLHAAAPYRKGKRGVSDVYVLSYITTLTALIRARRPSSLSSGSRSTKTHFVAIGQAQATGASEIPSVGIELAGIGHLVEGVTRFTCVEGSDACISRVSDEIGKHEWVHLACHGQPNQKKPFESAFVLYDGPFTIQRIIQCNLHNPEFAYLSACHTTVGDRESPDEVIHLASAMQFIGFRSVVGTMFAVDDSETNKVTSAFYKLMVHGSGNLDHTHAAHALQSALKTAGMPMDQRILYIHLGA